MSVYLDHNATAPIRPEAVDAVLRAMAIGGNPSSVHAHGRAARAAIEHARTQVAALIGAPASVTVFTSGGTEANDLAIMSAVDAGSKRIIVGATEHNSVLAAAQASGAKVDVWPVDAQGVADLAWLAEALEAWDLGDGRPLVCLMLANNETGVIQPVEAAARLVRQYDGWLHVDAIQGAGKTAVDFKALGADTLSLSAHKIGGPQGVGSLTHGPRVALTRQLHGGGQERNRRAGTENLGGIAGFGAAAETALQDLDKAEAQRPWRDAVAARLTQEAGVTVMGQDAPRLPNTLNIAAPGFASELQVMQMDLAGVMVSAGSACSSGKVTASHVLGAMGHSQLAGCAVRVSGGWNSTLSDWQRFADVWLEAHARHTARRQPAA